MFTNTYIKADVVYIIKTMINYNIKMMKRVSNKMIHENRAVNFGGGQREGGGGSCPLRFSHYIYIYIYMHKIVTNMSIIKYVIF